MTSGRETIVWSALVVLCVSVCPAFAADVDGDGVDDSVDVCVNTPPGILVDAAGRPRGDLDLDCDCDLDDFALFAGSFTGPLAPLVEDCDDGIDNDGDTLVDCEDAADCPSGSACADNAVCTLGECLCEGTWDDCDGAPANGCETDLLTDVNHCGQCFDPCVNAHGPTFCGNGQCNPVCVGLWGDCNGNPRDGCETPLSTLTDCGGCTVGCALPNASESCSTGNCQIVGCDNGFCNLNGVHPDGCEFALDTNPTCGSAQVLPPVAGDAGAQSVMVQERGEQWFRIFVSEQDNSGVTPHDLCLRVQLTVPSGTNYDLFAYCDGCTAVAASSTNGGSTAEMVIVRWEEETNAFGFPSGSDSGRTVFIRVVFASGAVCSEYTLTATGNQCGGPLTCSER